jgi:hypothetical protein
MTRLFSSFRIALLAVALGALPKVSSAGNFDGMWAGSLGHWNVQVAVAGSTAEVTLRCDINDGQPRTVAVPIEQNGTFTLWVGQEMNMARRKISAALPSFTIDPGGNCRGGTARLNRSE